MSVSEHQMDDTDLSVSLDVGDCHQELSLRRGTLGPDVVDIRTLYAGTAALPTIRVSPRPRAASRDHLHRRRQGRAPLSRLSHRRARREGELYRARYLLLYGELPTKNKMKNFKIRIATPHHGARADGLLLHAASGATRTRWRSGRRDGRDVGLLPRLRPTSPIRLAARGGDASGMIAKMPTIVAWAYKYSVGQPFVYPRN